MIKGARLGQLHGVKQVIVGLSTSTFWELREVQLLQDDLELVKTNIDSWAWEASGPRRTFTLLGNLPEIAGLHRKKRQFSRNWNAKYNPDNENKYGHFGLPSQLCDEFVELMEPRIRANLEAYGNENYA